MDESDIKRCGRQEAHPGHHWYEPLRSISLAAYGVSDDPGGPLSKVWYCRGNTGIPGIVVEVTIRPEPGTDGPRGGETFRIKAVLDPMYFVNDVRAEADAHEAALYLLARKAAERAAHDYHEAALKERAEAEGRPYLDVGQRARKRYEERYRTHPELPPVGPSPEGDRVRQIIANADARMAAERDRDAMRAWRAAGEPPILGATPEQSQCAHCGALVVRYDARQSWTSDPASPDAVACERSATGFHAPLQIPGTPA